MPLDPASPLLLAFAGALIVLVLKVQVLGAVTAATRGSIKRFITQEDATWLGGEYVYPDDPRVFRIFRAHANDMEALLPFFIVGALYIASGASAIAGMVYFALFVAARFTHTVAYLTRRPALRRNSFTVAWLATLAIGGHALWAIMAAARA